MLAPRVRRPRARHHRGEPAGADPRQPADGAVEQVRLARADDRQQVGELGRLLDALRRLGGRLRGDQGRAQDARLPARRLARRSATASGRCRARSSTARRAPSCGPTRRTPTRCPTTTRSTRSSRPTSRRTRAASSSRSPGCPRTRSARVFALVDRAEYKRRQAPPGVKITPRAFGRDRRMPITNAYRGELIRAAQRVEHLGVQEVAEADARDAELGEPGDRPARRGAAGC